MAPSCPILSPPSRNRRPCVRHIRPRGWRSTTDRGPETAQSNKEGAPKFSIPVIYSPVPKSSATTYIAAKAPANCVPMSRVATSAGGVAFLVFSALAGWYLGERSDKVRKVCARLLEWSGSIFYWAFLVCFVRVRRRRPLGDSASNRTNEVLTRLLQCMAKASLDDKSGSSSGGEESGGEDSLSVMLDKVLSTREWKEHLNYGYDRDKQMLVLDLDETLIHSSVEKKLLCKPAFLLYDEDQRQHFYVYKRPFVDVFLKLLAPLYHIVVYTASFSSYSDPIIDHIDVDSVIGRCLSNNSLVETKLYGLQKDLHLVSREHMPNRLVMIDNSPIACIANQENLYVINSFRANQPHDRELLSLFILLVALHGVDDLRSVVHRRSVFGSEGK